MSGIGGLCAGGVSAHRADEPIFLHYVRVRIAALHDACNRRDRMDSDQRESTLFITIPTYTNKENKRYSCYTGKRSMHSPQANHLKTNIASQPPLSFFPINSRALGALSAQFQSCPPLNSRYLPTFSLKRSYLHGRGYLPKALESHLGQLGYSHSWKLVKDKDFSPHANSNPPSDDDFYAQLLANTKRPPVRLSIDAHIE